MEDKDGKDEFSSNGQPQSEKFMKKKTSFILPPPKSNFKLTILKIA